MKVGPVGHRCELFSVLASPPHHPPQLHQLVALPLQIDSIIEDFCDLEKGSILVLYKLPQTGVRSRIPDSSEISALFGLDLIRSIGLLQLPRLGSSIICLIVCCRIENTYSPLSSWLFVGLTFERARQSVRFRDHSLVLVLADAISGLCRYLLRGRYLQPLMLSLRPVAVSSRKRVPSLIQVSSLIDLVVFALLLYS